jgi:hypothetical protein
LCRNEARIETSKLSKCHHHSNEQRSKTKDGPGSSRAGAIVVTIIAIKIRGILQHGWVLFQQCQPLLLFISKAGLRLDETIIITASTSIKYPSIPGIGAECSVSELAIERVEE